MRCWAAGVCGLVLVGCFDDAWCAPLEAYGQLPTFDHVVISPDGEKVAYVKDSPSNSYVVIQALAGGAILGGTKAENTKVRDLTWADDDRLLISYSSTTSIADIRGPKREWYVSICYDLAKKDQWPLMRNASEGDIRAMNISAGRPRARVVNGKTIAFVEGLFFPSGKSERGLFAANLDDHSVKLLEGKEVSDVDTQGWIVDHQGLAVAQLDYNQRSERWSVRAKRDGGWPEVLGVDAPIDGPWVVGLVRDDTSVLVRLSEDEGYRTKIVSLTDASVSEPSNELDPCRGFIVDRRSDRVIASIQVGATNKYTFLDPKDRTAWDSIAQAYSGEEVDFVSWSSDHRKVIVDIFGPRHGVSFELVDLDTNRATKIASVYSGIGPTDVSPVTLIDYKAADGLDIPAFLTLPRDRAAKDLPLIVNPHDGPAEHDEPVFDWMNQALASRGYAVLEPQFRGSNALGRQHLTAGFGQWGRKMQTDLSDGVRALAAKGVIDPRRVCILGAGYGGYAALAGATLDRGIYRCAVSIGGMADLRGFLSWVRERQVRHDSLAMRYWTRFIGVGDRDDPTLDQISPLKLADKVDVPVLLIHGSDDTVVPIGQSRDMARALKAAGKPVTLVELKDEDHWLSRSETRLQMLKATVDFLEANNPP